MNEPKLNIQAGYFSLQGRREDNQDFVSFTQPNSLDVGLHGIVAIVADGMGGAKGGRVAAETSVRMFIEGFYSTPETLGVEQAAAKSLDSANRWIHAVGQRDPELAGMATTFSALILRHRQAHLIHVGDSRIYRLRLGILEKLTEDHTLKHPDMDHILYRALGIVDTICAECVCLPLEAHDRFLLCSDGLYAVLRERELRQVLLERMSPETSAQTLSEMAYAKGSQDNITALVIDVISLPPPRRDSLQNLIGALPLLGLPQVGQSVDGYLLLRLLVIRFLQDILQYCHYYKI